MPKYTYAELMGMKHEDLDKICDSLIMKDYKDLKKPDKAKAIINVLEEQEIAASNAENTEPIPEESTQPTESTSSEETKKKDPVKEDIPADKDSEKSQDTPSEKKPKMFGKVVVKAFLKEGGYAVLGEITITEEMADKFYLPAIIKAVFIKPE